MTHSRPPHLLKIWCAGLCGSYVVLGLHDLMETLRHNKAHKGIEDFAESYYCDSCETSFVIAIETADVKPLTLNEKPDPS